MPINGPHLTPGMPNVLPPRTGNLPKPQPGLLQPAAPPKAYEGDQPPSLNQKFSALRLGEDPNFTKEDVRDIAALGRIDEILGGAISINHNVINAANEELRRAARGEVSEEGTKALQVLGVYNQQTSILQRINNKAYRMSNEFPERASEFLRIIEPINIKPAEGMEAELSRLKKIDEQLDTLMATP